MSAGAGDVTGQEETVAHGGSGQLPKLQSDDVHEVGGPVLSCPILSCPELQTVMSCLALLVPPASLRLSQWSPAWQGRI